MRYQLLKGLGLRVLEGCRNRYLRLLQSSIYLLLKAGHEAADVVAVGIFRIHDRNNLAI